jgi:hypothetical protein
MADRAAASMPSVGGKFADGRLFWNVDSARPAAWTGRRTVKLTGGMMFLSFSARTEALLAGVEEVLGRRPAKVAWRSEKFYRALGARSRSHSWASYSDAGARPDPLISIDPSGPAKMGSRRLPRSETA